MKRPILYLMLGYPGAGKTTIAGLIHELTGAVHIWEDKVRLEKFPQPTLVHGHSSSFKQEENDELHNYLNTKTGELLAMGQSVVYDTSFNAYEDRARMYHIADAAGSDTLLIWVNTNKTVARERATKNTAEQETRIIASVLGDMNAETFERLSQKLEPPRSDEVAMIIEGTHVTKEQIRQLLQPYQT